MALSKRITLPNGVAVNYHRVVRVDIVTNQQNVVEVASYTSRAKRREEKDWYARDGGQDGADGEGIDVYIETTLFDVPYDQDMTVESAYGWLKAQPMFEGAIDAADA